MIRSGSYALDWLDLNWSEPYRFAERLEAGPPDTGLYRIWYEEQDSVLAYIGESSNILLHLRDHEKTFGEDALFAYAEWSGLDASHKREEIETDLIGAYYLVVGERRSRSSDVLRTFLSKEFDLFHLSEHT